MIRDKIYSYLDTKWGYCSSYRKWRKGYWIRTPGIYGYWKLVDSATFKWISDADKWNDAYRYEIYT